MSHFHFVSFSVPWQWFQRVLCCSTPRALDRRQSGTWDTEPKPFIPFVISLRQYAVIFVVVIYLKSIQMEKLIVNICIQINILNNKQQAPSSSFQCTKEQSGLSRTSLQLCDWRCDWLNKKGFFFKKGSNGVLHGRNQNRNKIYTNHVNNINRKIYFETVGALLLLTTYN